MLSHSRRLCSPRALTLLGIETSCDDTAVAIVRSDRRVVASRRHAERGHQARLGGICPATVAQQHRRELPRLIEECLDESRLRQGDLDGVAVSTRPGLVIALKEGMYAALRVARDARVPLVPVHHMRAHALVAGLVHDQLRFPFVALLISGGHSLLVLVHSPSSFDIIGDSEGGSAGECLDKVGRALGLDSSCMHPGAAVEAAAARFSSRGHERYAFRGVPSERGASFHFSGLKSSFLGHLQRIGDDVHVEDFCASAQHHIARHLCSRVHTALEYLRGSEEIDGRTQLVVGGGVASNRYIFASLAKLAAHHGLAALRIPPSLCTDNAEMIAWSGILAMQHSDPSIIPALALPSSLYVEDRSPIGRDRTEEIPRHPRHMLKVSSIHPDDSPIIVHDKMAFLAQAKR